MTGLQVFQALDANQQKLEQHHRAILACMAEQRRLERQIVKIANRDLKAKKRGQKCGQKLKPWTPPSARRAAA